jgi:hypothetical protein
VELGIGDPESEAGEQRFSILPRDLAFAQANPGYLPFSIFLMIDGFMVDSRIGEAWTSISLEMSSLRMSMRYFAIEV